MNPKNKEMKMEILGKIDENKFKKKILKAVKK